MTKQARIFLNDITVIDHAFINSDGIVVGGSYQATAVVEGAVTEDEQVVVDFSRVKKDIKETIDSKSMGLDHKTWIIMGFSSLNELMQVAEENGNSYVRTASTMLDVPISALAVIESIPYTAGDLSAPEIVRLSAEKHLSKIVTEELRNKHEGVLSVKITLSQVPHTGSSSPSSEAFWDIGFFRYVHGLKDSSSWGCQNIAHGHLSYIQAWADDEFIDQSTDTAQQITKELSQTLFVNRANISANDDETLSIRYKSPRGHFSMIVNKDAYNIHILDTETTIEHLVDYISTRWKAEWKKAGVTHLYVSEGLSKGAIATIK